MCMKESKEQHSELSAVDVQSYPFPDPPGTQVFPDALCCSDWLCAQLSLPGGLCPSPSVTGHPQGSSQWKPWVSTEREAWPTLWQVLSFCWAAFSMAPRHFKHRAMRRCGQEDTLSPLSHCAWTDTTPLIVHSPGSPRSTTVPFPWFPLMTSNFGTT